MTPRSRLFRGFRFDVVRLLISIFDAFAVRLFSTAFTSNRSFVVIRKKDELLFLLIVIRFDRLARMFEYRISKKRDFISFFFFFYFLRK